MTNYEALLRLRPRRHPCRRRCASSTDSACCPTSPTPSVDYKHRQSVSSVKLIMQCRRLRQIVLVVAVLFAAIHPASLGRSPTLGCQNGGNTTFSCRSEPRTCLHRMHWQDGIVDCPDGSDEECQPWQYDCKLGKPRCVDLWQLHDGSIDCMSGFDEACPPDFFVCMDRSACIDMERLLDGRVDCADGSDEPCPAGYFGCKTDTQCVPEEKYQDGVEDCADGSDEGCTVFQYECRCGEPRCIGLEQLDDGVAQCSDGSDEPRALLFSKSVPRRNSSSICPGGSKPRHSILIDRTQLVQRVAIPPNPPMVPCRDTDINLCRAELNEMCVLVGGVPRCMCRMGAIRPPGSAKCIAMPRIVNLDNVDATKLKMTDVRRAENLTLVPLDDNPAMSGPHKLAVRKTTGNLDKSRFEGANIAPCDPNELSSCNFVANQHCALDRELQIHRCMCDDGFVRDGASGDCILLRNECEDPLLNDCDPNAACMDNAMSYECLCKAGYLDMSPVPTIKPGIHCLPLVNECANRRLHDCSAFARCIDLPGGYTCQCQPGYFDMSPGRPHLPGRLCTKAVDECSLGVHNCSDLATCQDTMEGYICRCKVGTIDISPDPVALPGRVCTSILNECLGAAGGNDCDPENARCVDIPEGYECRCKSGYLDLDPARPGRRCVPGSNPCADYSLHDCDREAICQSDRPGFFQCSCPPGFVDLSPDTVRFPGRRCRQEVDECALGTAKCDKNAECMNTPESYTCTCPSGWVDKSTRPINEPGRKCEKPSDDACDQVQCGDNSQCVSGSNGAAPKCQCQNGFADVSDQYGEDPGKRCVELVNECTTAAHDCSPSARCIDEPEGFTCRCHDGYRDESPDAADRPGRVCVQAFSPEPPECDVRDPLSCDPKKFEACLFVEGTYKCRCPNGISRLPDGRCRVVNECADPRLNECSPQATCVDQAESYTCQCRTGHVDVSEDKKNKPGRECKLIEDECRSPDRFGVDCHKEAVCVDVEDGYQCRCLPGFADVSETVNRLPGRLCVEAVDECQNGEQNDCSVNAICEDAKQGYTCRCRDGFVDASPEKEIYPGRVCNKPTSDPKDPDTDFQVDACDPSNIQACDRGEVCTDRSQKGRFVCECGEGLTRYEGDCRVFSACDEEEHDCDKDGAVCSNIFDAYQCQCKPGYLDVSPDPIANPGRKCKPLENECATRALNDCDPVSMCIDARDGYVCMCPKGFTDVSSQYDEPIGRRCVNSSNECASPTLNTCDENADCIDTVDGYECVCIDGFVDVSSNANLEPGRVCTVQTKCPKQKTDLMFLVDGSGSIGTFTFRNDVLRFVREFVELFDIGPEGSRIAMIQFSEQIRHEFDFSTFSDKRGVLQGITDVKYMTGLTNTGGAMKHMLTEGYSQRRGARIGEKDVVKIAVVITDGRSQDNVADPGKEVREAGIEVFAIGVTDHIKDSELELISGSKDRSFHVDEFADLDKRLRSLVQKLACPEGPPPPKEPGRCDPLSQTGCDRTLNEVCVERENVFVCECPDGFKRHPVSQICGGKECNPRVPATCPWPEVCKQTPFGNFRCSCPDPYIREGVKGTCGDSDTDSESKICQPGDSESCGENQSCEKQADGRFKCLCSSGFEWHARAQKCVPPDWCDAGVGDKDCDQNKREKCLESKSAGYFRCQCPPNHTRQPATGVCLIDECLTGKHECDKNAKCTDITDGYLCTCKDGFQDISADPIKKPGRVCTLQSIDECKAGDTVCDPNAHCIDTETGYVCECNVGFIDVSPNPRKLPGVKCKPLVNECAKPELNDCHAKALCIDTRESYVCECLPGFEDKDLLRNPGRRCEEKIDPCATPDGNDCDRNAKCITRSDGSYECACLPDYKDRSPDPLNKPGRSCILIPFECDNPALNDCDSPERAMCTDTDDGYLCRCKPNYVDISADPVSKPGRLCKPLVDECTNGQHDCALVGGICEDTPESYVCRCDPHYLDVSSDPINQPGRQCKLLVNECETGQNDCSANADCIDTEDSYVCDCKDGFHDQSPDPVTKPGRTCIQLINECTVDPPRHDCSPNARCIDTIDSFRCQCLENYDENSPDPNRQGRLCTPQLKDECRSGEHDCHRHATCKDTPESFTCQCNEFFVDTSPDPILQPGRQCEPKPTPPPPECNIQDASSCKVELKEVCRLIDGKPKCTCPENYSRNQNTNACTVINECQFPFLNDCDIPERADCTDKADGYECKCKEGFKDSNLQNPGRICIPLIDECKFSHLHDCHQFAKCINQEEGYTCECNEGYADVSPDKSGKPGRICRRLVDECADSTKNTCDPNAKCVDEMFGYKCECKEGYLDVSPSPANPGRACKEIVDECADPSLNDCHEVAKCTDTPESYRCDCPAESRDISPNPAFPGRVCQVFSNECETGRHDCDQNADCRDTEDSFTCKCKDGFIDRSPDLKRRGRVCIKLVDECETGEHTCAKQAECRDLEDGYTCECKNGFIDKSPDLTQAGRVCVPPEVCPRDDKCSKAAVCVPIDAVNYECECLPGYVDRSPEGERPGTICIRANDCLDTNLNDCSAHAVCINGRRRGELSCICEQGFIDTSRENGLGPGRVCVPLVPVYANRDPYRVVLPDRENVGLPTGAGGPLKPLPTIMPFPVPKHYPAVTNGLPKVARRPAVFTTVAAIDFGMPDRFGKPKTMKPGDFDPLFDNECRDPALNNCSRNAICYDLPVGYRCDCITGFVDRSPDENLPGRICEQERPEPPKLHACQDPSLNDCSNLGTCSSVQGGGPEDYTCACPPNGYADRSPDPNLPGRVCVSFDPVCIDPEQNDCHQFAICTPVDDPRKYTCQCRDGFVDESPEPRVAPGRVCTPIVNECLDANLNDCDRNHGLCQDEPKGYTCRCPPGTKDTSPDPQAKPGRKCIELVNECQTKLHNCSRFAECIDKEIGFDCKCLPNYHDNKPSEPGRQCEFIINECESVNLHDCSNYADCIDLPGGFDCKCWQGYNDVSADPDRKGRTCQANECADPNLNDCAPEADCQDLLDGYSCICPRTHIDVSPDPLKPGRACQPAPSTLPPITVPTAPPNSIKCGDGLFCLLALGEECRNNPLRCECKKGTARQKPGEICQPAVEFDIPLRVFSRGGKVLVYSSEYGDPSKPAYIDIAKTFEDAMGRQMAITPVSPAFLATDTEFIKPPGLFDPEWQDGLMFNTTLKFRPDHGIKDRCELWTYLMDSLRQTNRQIGSSDMYTAAEQLDLCPVEDKCGNEVCRAELGEICSAVGQVCICPEGMKRSGPNAKCRPVEGIPMALWVVRRCDGACKGKQDELQYEKDYTDPSTDLHKLFAQLFRGGVDDTYGARPETDPYFVTSDVNFIQDPKVHNKTWDKGLLYNFTAYFTPNTVAPEDAWNSLYDGCKGNNYELGDSGLYIDPFQSNPFSPCFKSNCHPNAQCIPRGPNSYTCKCNPGFVDLAPSPEPGRNCQSETGVNECLLGTHKCDPNAKCIDQNYLYRCECHKDYTDASPKGTIPGSVCRLNFCNDVDFCPENTTCVNLADRADCQCNDGFVSIRQSPKSKRFSLGLEGVYCLKTQDIDECSLGLTDCHSVSICTDLLGGYECQCPPGYVEGLDNSPGRICSAALCDMCNGRGDCVYDVNDRSAINGTCLCHPGFSGPFCEVSAASVRLYVVIILAILFLLLSLCCLLFFCLQCRCVRAGGLWYREPLFTYRRSGWPWGTLEQSSSSESGEDKSGMWSAMGKGSDYYPPFEIPRPKTKGAAQLSDYLDHGRRAERDASEIGVHDHAAYESDDASSEYTIREEVERRVVTDVRKTEYRTTNADVHTSSEQSAGAGAMVSGGANSSATAQFSVYPPGGRHGQRAADEGTAVVPIPKQRRRRRHIFTFNLDGSSREDVSSLADYGTGVRLVRAAPLKNKAAEKRQSKRSDMQLDDSDSCGGVGRTIYSPWPSPPAPLDTAAVMAVGSRPMSTKSERERGQSEAAFSVGGMTHESGSELRNADDRDRAMSEYTERESTDGSATVVSNESEADTFDKKVLVREQRGFEPDPDGRGGTQRYGHATQVHTQAREVQRH